MTSLDDLKAIRSHEINDIQHNLEENYSQNNNADKIMLRVADRYEIIRINTLRCFLQVIAKLEQGGYVY